MFPVGTVVTGTSALAGSSGADLFRVVATVLFIVLLAAWTTVCRVILNLHETITRY